jgi:gliding motility-associated-like protein
VAFVGVCTPPLKATGYSVGSTANFANNAHYCVGTPLPQTSPNGMLGTWNPNLVIAGTNNYTFSSTVCSTPQVVSIIGDPTVVPTFNPIAAICQGSPAPALPANSTNATPILGTWNPAVINTAVVGPQTYTFTPNAGQCAGPVSITVTISAKPTPTFAAYPATLCQNSAAPALPASTNGIAGTWNPATINTATLGPKSATFIPTPGQCVSATPVVINVNIVTNVTPTFAPIGPICSGSTPIPTLPATSLEGITGTWNPAVISNTATQPYTFTPTAGQCATLGSSLTVTVKPNITTTFNFASTTLTFCSGTAVPNLPATSSNSPAITGTWSQAAISNTANGMYIFTPTPGQCASVYTLNVVITPTVGIQFTTLPNNFSICIGSPPPALPTSSSNTQPITGTWSPAAINTATAGTRNYTFTATPGQCVTSQTYVITVTVTPKTTPVYGPIAPFCQGTIPPQGLALPTTIGGVVGTWSPSTTIDNNASDVYTFTPAANQCANPINLNITITPRDIPVFTPIPAFCAGTTPVPTLPAVSNNGITGTWLPATINNMATDTYNFFPDAGQCAANGSLTITVNQPVSPDFDDIEFCDGAAVPSLSPISPIGINGIWNPAVIDPTISSYVFTPDAGECATTQTINVTIHPLTLNDVTWSATSYFSDDAVITVIATDPGNYLYQLDFGPIQPSNIFDHVPPGSHTITVYDAYGCSAPIVRQDAVVIVDYPHFFTPNGDGMNDTWDIFDLNMVGQEQAAIHIFDRYGKLLKQIAPAGLGWDGTYNGQPMPSSDYWFVVKYMELGVPREFKSHFSLKR